MDKTTKPTYPSSASIVALRFPDGISRKIYDSTKGVPGALKMGDHHVTMAYLGDDLDDDAQARVRKAVKMFAANTPPLEGGSLSGTGSFKKGANGVPWYANVKMAGLDTMHKGLRGALGKEGIKMAGAHATGKPFVPHATLAYLSDDTQSPDAGVDMDGLQFGSLYLKMGGGEYKEYPLTGEKKAYDLSGRVDIVKGAWQSRMRDQYGDNWWDEGYQVAKVQEDALVVTKGPQAFFIPYAIDDGVVSFGEMKPGTLQFTPKDNMGELKMCTPEHARKMYAKMYSDNRVLDVADGNIIYEDAQDKKCYRRGYKGDGDKVSFGDPVAIKMSYADMEDEETKAGRRMAAPNIGKLEKIKETLSQAVAGIDQVLLWAGYLDGTGKAFPDWLKLEPLAEWVAEAASIKAFDVPPMYLKAIKGKETDKGVVVGGYMAPWGSPTRRDLQLDYFTPETNFFLEHYPNAPTLFQHGKDPTIKASVLGQREDARADDVGLWVEDWLDKSNKFWPMVKALLERRALYYSPGAVPHLVDRTPDRQLKTFPIADDTITPTPVLAPLLMGRPLEYIKSAYAEVGIELTDPPGLGEGAGKAPMSAVEKANEQRLKLALLNLQRRFNKAL